MKKQEKRMLQLQMMTAIEAFAVASQQEDPGKAVYHVSYLVTSLLSRVAENVENWRKYQMMTDEAVKLAVIEQAEQLTHQIDNAIIAAKGGLK